MKTILLIGLVLMCGCREKPPDSSVSIGNSRHFIAFTYEGHQYLASYRGGLIHSESCTNHSIGSAVSEPLLVPVGTALIDWPTNTPAR